MAGKVALIFCQESYEVMGQYRIKNPHRIPGTEDSGQGGDKDSGNRPEEAREVVSLETIEPESGPSPRKLTQDDRDKMMATTFVVRKGMMGRLTSDWSSVFNPIRRRNS